jgi:hypothetical protein
MADYRQGDIAENPDGQRLQLLGNKWVPIASRQEAARADAYRQLAEETPAWQAGLIGVGRAMGGGWRYDGDRQQGAEAFQALQRAHPYATTAGQIVPAVVAGVATGGASLPLAGRMALGAASEAGMGVLGSPEAPGQAALLGGTFGALMPAVPAAFGAARRGLVGAGEVAQDLASQLPGRMGDRVRARMMAAAEPGGAGGGGAGAAAAGAVPPGGQGGYLKGFFHPDEAQALGLPLTPGDDLMLRAENATQADVAGRLRSLEEVRRSSPTLGGGINTTRDAQRNWLTDYVAQAAGEAPGQRLTPASIGAAFERVGKVYDDVLKAVGPVELPRDVLSTLEEITMEARGGYQSRLGKIHDELVTRIIKNGGAVGPEDWAYAKHQLGRMEATALRQGDHAQLGDVTAYKQALQEGMMENAPQEAQAALTQANGQYRILKALTKNSAVMDPQGNINARSLANALGNNPGRFKNARTDELLRAIDTLEFLQAKTVNNSGTAERILSALPQAAGVAGPFGTLGGLAAGGSALYGLFKD